MAYGQSSGTTNFSPFASDILLDAYERIGVFDLEGKHLQSGRRSLNLLLTSDWSNRGINLWRMQQIVMPLAQGVAEYSLTRDVAAVYDCYRRQYIMNQAQSYTPDFTTQSGSRNVMIAIPGASSPVGSYIGVAVPVSVGGIVLYGFYQVTATPTVNSVTVQAAAAATATVSAGGVVPQFTTTASSQNVTVTLPNHGAVPGGPFVVQVSTAVGGVTLYGNYIVQSVTDADNFVIQASANALSSTSAYENSGDAFISTQDQVAPYTDILMTQLSRYDYAAMANKTATGAPTTLWVNKQIIPTFNIWPVTDATGPYEIHMWCMVQIEDVNPTGGQTLDLPPRFYYAMVTDLARDLSIKFAPDKYQLLKAEADAAWMRAQSSDVEPTSTFIMPNMPTGLN